MGLILRLDRELSVRIPGRVDSATFGDLYVENERFCDTLEDEVREVPYRPVSDWKLPERTAIPSGIFTLGLVNSPHFGPDTLAVMGVPGFADIRIHGGTTVEDTKGCPMVGDVEDRIHMTIAGAKFHHVLERLKEKVRPAIDRGERVLIQIRNAPEWYLANGLPVTKAFA